MKAAVYYGQGDVRIEQVDDPPGPGSGEVLVAPRWCGICGTDVHEYTDGPIVTCPEPHPLTGAVLPQILGHEFSAEVLEVGSGVSGLRAGDRVSVMPLVSCRTCYFCARGMNQMCLTMACTGLSHRWGGLAEAAVLAADQVTVLPAEVDDRQGALVEPLAVSANGVDRAGVAPGHSVLVTGAGPIGILAAEYALARGATQVFVSEPNPLRRQVVSQLDVTAVLDPTAHDVVEEIRERTGGLGADAAIECSGKEIALDTCIAAVRTRGMVVQTGLHLAPAPIDAFSLAQREITLAGTWCYPVRDWPRIISLLAAGRLRGTPAVTATLGIESTVEGFERLIDPAGGDAKILIGAGA